MTQLLVLMEEKNLDGWCCHWKKRQCSGDHEGMLGGDGGFLLSLQHRPKLSASMVPTDRNVTHTHPHHSTEVNSIRRESEVRSHHGQGTYVVPLCIDVTRHGESI